MIQNVFFDLDDTLLDFRKAERSSIAETLKEFGVEPTDATIDRYSEINDSLWKKLERGEIKREQLLSERFRILFRELGAYAPVEDVRQAYEARLAKSHFLMPEADSTLRSLYGRYRLFIASNGITRVQKSRIAGSGIGKYFENVFISEEIGCDKPSAKFFERSFEKIKGFRREYSIIVGDSMSSDIAGGRAAGILTCLYNPRSLPKKQGESASFEIRRLSELPELLENI